MPAEAKMIPTPESVDAFIDTVPDTAKQQDSRTLIELMSELTGKPAVMWGPSIIGFDSYHYKYASGREGDAPALGFSPRKAALTIYLFYGAENHTDLLAKLGPHKLSKACLYIKHLSDINMAVLKQLIELSYNELRAYEKEHWT